MANLGKLPPRSLESFGIAGLLAEDCSVYYDTLFSTRHFGKVSDLLMAKLRQHGLDELRLRAMVLFSLFEAYRTQVPAEEVLTPRDEPLQEPLVIETGFDGEKVAVGLSFNLPAESAVQVDGMERRVRSGEPRDDFDVLLQTLLVYSDQLLVRYQESARRIEIVSLIGVLGKIEQVQLEPSEQFSVIMIGQQAENTPNASVYEALADMDYAKLLKDDSPSATAEAGAPATGQIIADNFDPTQVVLKTFMERGVQEQLEQAKLGGAAAGGIGKSQVGGQETDSDGRTSISSVTENRNDDVFRISGSGPGESSDPGFKFSGAKSGGDQVHAFSKDGVGGIPLGGSPEAQNRLYQQANEELQRKVQELEAELRKRKGAGGASGGLRSSLLSFFKGGQKSSALDEADQTQPGRQRRSASRGADGRTDPLNQIIEGDSTLSSEPPEIAAATDDTGAEVPRATDEGSPSKKSNERPTSSKPAVRAASDEEEEFDEQDEEDESSPDEEEPDSESDEKKSKPKKGGFFKKLVSTFFEETVEVKKTTKKADSDEDDEEESESLTGSSPSLSERPPAHTSKSGEEDANAEKALKEFITEVSAPGGGLSKAIDTVEQESSRIKKEGGSAAQRVVDGLMSELVAERARLQQLGQKLNRSIRAKELEFRNKERAMQQELSQRDEQVRQKNFAVSHAKEQLAQANAAIQRLKDTGEASAGDAQYKSKYTHLQRNFTITKQENAQLQKKVEELRSSLTAANSKARTQSTTEVTDLKEKLERAMKQADELKRVNNQLVEKVNQAKEGGGSTPDKETKKRLEAALKMATTYKRETETLNLRIEELQKEVSNLKSGKPSKAA